MKVYIVYTCAVCVMQTGGQGLDNGETEGSGLLVYWYSGSLPGRQRGRVFDCVTRKEKEEGKRNQR